MQSIRLAVLRQTMSMLLKPRSQKELEDLKAQMVVELESQHVPSVLTTEEHRASNQCTKILQAHANQLWSEGVTLHHGCKSKTAHTLL